MRQGLFSIFKKDPGGHCTGESEERQMEGGEVREARLALAFPKGAIVRFGQGNDVI